MIQMRSWPRLSCLSPQMLHDTVETMQLLANHGMLKAAASLAHFLGSAFASPPIAGGSPGRQRRRRRRKRGSSRTASCSMETGQGQHCHHRGFDIKSMSVRIDVLASMYSPIKHPPRVEPEELAQPEGGLVSGTTPTPLPDHQVKFPRTEAGTQAEVENTVSQEQ